MKIPILTILAIVLLSSLVIGTIVACGDQEGDSHESEGADSGFFRVPQHTVLEVEDLSIGDAVRIGYRVRVPKGFSQEEGRLVAHAIIDKNHRKDDIVNAVTFWFYFPESDPNDIADGQFDWAPRGRWGRRCDG